MGKSLNTKAVYRMFALSSFYGSFGRVAVLAVGHWASLAGDVFGSNFFIGPRQVILVNTPANRQNSNANKPFVGNMTSLEMSRVSFHGLFHITT